MDKNQFSKKINQIKYNINWYNKVLPFISTIYPDQVIMTDKYGKEYLGVQIKYNK